eukprot:NODE_2487_length_528_cov_1358.983299_g1938_i0.p1 GENE.NODE_2487_length_528_cov_1358.983299_g1938_i0~~NODE_2487_length_528_cov_1358.983299_g1938_i0.p1  ORF type:complete len:136 (+),score=67.52 NODE_2487_length_528_cov_1358.983299_g1938_i0:35-442(+)
MGGKKKGKSKPAKKEEAVEGAEKQPVKDQRLKLTMVQLQQFHRIGVQNPTMTSHVAAAVQTLKAKQAEFETMKKTQEEVDAEEEEERAKAEAKAEAEKARREASKAEEQEVEAAPEESEEKPQEEEEEEVEEEKQ